MGVRVMYLYVLGVMVAVSSVLAVYYYRRYVELRSRLSRREKYGDELNARILELYRKGYSLRQIARELGVSHSTVHRRLKKLLEMYPPETLGTEKVLVKN